jgi:hypothetical protein
MNTNSRNDFGRIHLPSNKVKIVGSDYGLAIELKPNRLGKQISRENKMKSFPKRKFQDTNLF